MNNPTLLEACYKRYAKDIGKWLPDGAIEVDLELLHNLNLLHFHHPYIEDSPLTRYFHVVESEEKLTLVNDEFIVWIVPDNVDGIPITTILIALNHSEEIRLELAFTTSGVYNHSHLVLRVLEKLLQDIHSTEEALSELEKRNINGI